MIEIKKVKPFIRLMASSLCRVEGEALRQLEKAGELHGMEVAVGLPDLHPGVGNPIGAALLTNNMIYPHIVGSDVGCGIGLWKTSLKTNKVKRDKWAKKLKRLELPWDGDARQWLSEWGLDSSEFDIVLGSIGGGNHFAELQMVEHIHCLRDFAGLGLDENRFYLLVHSGSRGMGAGLLRRHTERFGAAGLVEASEEAQRYLDVHALAVHWARANRALIAERFCRQLNSDCDLLLDVCHNSVAPVDIEGESGWLHRKGAVPSDQGALVIPGSRGALSYLVLPQNDQRLNLWSLAHGAGRKWNRGSCKARLKNMTSAKALCRTDLGGVVICDDRELLFEEAPQAYKNIDSVISDMQREGLIRVVATLRPLITYKTRRTR